MPQILPSFGLDFVTAQRLKGEATPTVFSWKNRDAIDKVFQNTKELYGNRFEMDPDEFAIQMSTKENRKKFFDAITAEFPSPLDFNAFDEKLSKDLFVIGDEDRVIEGGAGALKAAESGLESSLPGLIARGKAPDIYEPIGITEKLIQAGTQMTGDLPAFIVSNLIFKSPAGSIGLTEGARAALIDHYERGGETFDDYMFSLKAGVDAGLKAGGAAGVGEALGGKLFPIVKDEAGNIIKNPVAGRSAAMVVGMTSASALVEGRVPTLDDFIINGALIGGAHLGPKAASFLMRLFKKKGVSPADLNLKDNADAIRDILEGKESEEAKIEKIKKLPGVGLEEGLFPGEIERLKNAGMTPERVAEEQAKITALNAARKEAQRIIDEHAKVDDFKASVDQEDLYYSIKTRTRRMLPEHAEPAVAKYEQQRAAEDIAEIKNTPENIRKGKQQRAKERAKPDEGTSIIKELQAEEERQIQKAAKRVEEQMVEFPIDSPEAVKSKMEAIHQKLAADAWKTTVAIAKAIKALTTPDPNALHSGFGITEEGWNKAKPFFDEGWKKFKAAGKGVLDFTNAMNEELGPAYAPYMDRWRQWAAENGVEGLGGHSSYTNRSSGIVGEINERNSFADKLRAKVADPISTTDKFDRIGAKGTSKAVWTAPSKESYYLEQGLRAATQLVYGSDFKFGGLKGKKVGKEDFLNIMLAQEGSISKTGLSDAVIEAANKLEDFYEYGRQEYAKRGVKLDWKGNSKRRITEYIKNHPNMDPAKKAVMEETLKSLDNLNFSHIPLYFWLGENAVRNPAGMKRVLGLLNLHKRETLSIKSLIEKGIVSEGDINPVDAILSYARRMGRDLALLDIVNAAKEEGLAYHKGDYFQAVESGKANPSMFTKAPNNAPILKDNFVHHTLDRWIREQAYIQEHWGFFNKVLSTVKMGAFYNFAILPAMDLAQAAMTTQLRTIRSGNIKKAFHDVIRKTDNYQEAMMEGYASKPDGWLPNKVLENLIVSTKEGTMSELAKSLNMIFKSGETGEGLAKLFREGNIIRHIYDTSFQVAWTLDEVVRMMTYNWAKGKGMTPEEAGKFTARTHGDYAGVPPKTRRALNTLFFTPTFKIAMGKLFTRMITDSLKFATSSEARKRPDVRAMAGGLVTALAINYGIDLLMQGLGFKRDVWGYKYYKETDEGKDIVISYGGPTSLINKTANRITSAFSDPGTENKYTKLLSNFKWEIHPIYRLASEAVSNSDGFGGKIRSEGDTDKVAFAKTLKHITFGTWQVLKLAENKPKDKETREEIKKEFGNTWDIAIKMFPLSNAYTREGKDFRNAVAAKAKYNRMMKEMIDGTITNDKQLDKFLDDIIKTLER